MADLFGGDTQTITQTAGGGGLAGFLQKLGDVGLSFTGDNKKEPDLEEAIDQLIDSILNKGPSGSAVPPVDLSAGAPTPALGLVQDRLLTPRAGATSTSSNVQDRLIPSSLGGPVAPSLSRFPPSLGPPGPPGGLLESLLGNQLPSIQQNLPLLLKDFLVR